MLRRAVRARPRRRRRVRPGAGRRRSAARRRRPGGGGRGARRAPDRGSRKRGDVGRGARRYRSRHAGLRRRRARRRGHDDGGPARTGRPLGGRRPARRRRRRSARAGRHLPHLLDDQAHHQRRHHDPDGGRRALAGRPGLPVHSAVRRRAGPGGRRRACPAERPDHHRASADSHVGSHLRVLRRHARRPPLQRIGLLRRRAGAGGLCRSGGGPAAAGQPGRALELQRVDRHPRPGDRGRLRSAVRRLPAGADPGSTGNGRHRLRGARGETRPFHRQLRAPGRHACG